MKLCVMQKDGLYEIQKNLIMRLDYLVQIEIRDNKCRDNDIIELSAMIFACKMDIDIENLGECNDNQIN